MVILTVSTLLVFEHGIPFHVFVSASVSFISFLQFSNYRSLLLWVSLVLDVSFFWCDHSRIVSLTFLSESSFLVHRNATNCCVLTLCPAALPVHRWYLVIFWWCHWDSLCVQQHIFCRQWQFTCFISNLDCFSSFYFSDYCG